MNLRTWMNRRLMTRITFKSTPLKEVNDLKHHEILGYFMVYIDDNLVFFRLEGADTYSYLNHLMKRQESDYREALKTEIYEWCQRNGYSCQSEMNCEAYESLSDVYWVTTEDREIGISVVRGSHHHAREKARIYSQILHRTDVKGIFEHQRFV